MQDEQPIPVRQFPSAPSPTAAALMQILPSAQMHPSECAHSRLRCFQLAKVVHEPHRLLTHMGHACTQSSPPQAAPTGRKKNNKHKTDRISRQTQTGRVDLLRPWPIHVGAVIDRPLTDSAFSSRNNCSRARPLEFSVVSPCRGATVRRFIGTAGDDPLVR